MEMENGSKRVKLILQCNRNIRALEYIFNALISLLFMLSGFGILSRRDGAPTKR